MENKDTKYYTGSDGIEKDVKEIESTHLFNALSKAYRNVFESQNIDDFNAKIEVINTLKEEAHRRVNEFGAALEVK